MAIPTISDIAGIISTPELRFTQSGKAVMSVRLAFNDSKYDEQQQKWVNSKTFYVDGQAWEQTAERLADQLAQGDQVYVVGRIETQTWERDGEKKSKPVLNLSTVRKLAKNEGGQQRQQQQPRTQQAPPQDDPWATPAAQSGGWGNGPDTEPAF
ncbi:single-stranded DNA-binding protein [Paenarthrobacter sp. NPDC018779]|uniref:single-stranded DNA-binding protein n=1 Tax=Paenarthrobacter sp. NPDC018779 TaxID=3364375 RepID=UPI0037C6B066